MQATLGMHRESTSASDGPNQGWTGTEGQRLGQWPRLKCRRASSGHNSHPPATQKTIRSGTIPRPGNGSQAEGSDHSHQSGRSLWSCDWPGSSLSAPTSAAPRRIPCWGLEDPAAEGGVSSHGSFPSSTLRAPERLSQAMGPSS